MSTISESPSPIKNPDWNNQVKIGRGYSDPGGFHRASAIAAELFKAGKWNGRGLLVVHAPYDTHRKLDFLCEELVIGIDYEFADDSIYQGAGPVEETEETEETAEREPDDDETLTLGQNYSWYAANEEW